MKIGDRVYVHGHVDEIRKDTVIIQNSGGYFGTDKAEIIEAQNREEIANVILCKDCKHWDGYYCHNKNWGDGYGNYPPPIKKEDGFCDWAERREEWAKR